MAPCAGRHGARRVGVTRRTGGAVVQSRPTAGRRHRPAARRPRSGARRRAGRRRFVRRRRRSLPEDDAGFSRALRRRGPAPSAIVRERARRLEGQRLRSHRRRARQPRPRRTARDLAARRRARIATAPDRYELDGVSELAAIDGLVRAGARSHATVSRSTTSTITAPDLVAQVGARARRSSPSPTNGITALVLRGRGEVDFSPADPAEQSQMRLFNRRPSFVSPSRRRVRAREPVGVRRTAAPGRA